MVRSAFADLCVPDPPASSDFYRRLLTLDVISDHGWYIELGREGVVMIAFVQAAHPTIPGSAGSPPRGLLVSFDVDDAAETAHTAHAMGCQFAVEPIRELGQYHFMVVDPNGVLIDVIERVPFSASDRRRLATYRRAHRESTYR